MKQHIDVPKTIEGFITQAIMMDNLMLPYFYPSIADFNAFQQGYKIDNDNKENGFKSSWWVICSNYFNDPFFVDFDEFEQDFPVYFAFHGQGVWRPLLIAPSLSAFETIITEIQKVQDDRAEYLAYLQNHVDLNHEFWQEVYQNTLEKEEYSDDDNEQEYQHISLEDYAHVALWITDIGQNKMAVIKYLKQALNLTPKQALNLPNELPFKYCEGVKLVLLRDFAELQSLGVTCQWVEQAEE